MSNVLWELKGSAMKAIHVTGLKSFFTSQRIELSDVTIFSGANSSGKSTASQALLLLKQTIESQYDPGVLLLDGPNARFTSLDQMLSKRPGAAQRTSFKIGFETGDDWLLSIEYGRRKTTGVEIRSAQLRDPRGRELSFKENRKFSEAETNLLNEWEPSPAKMLKSLGELNLKSRWAAIPARCFPDLKLIAEFESPNVSAAQELELGTFDFQRKLRREISQIIHIQGLRGNPERTYTATARVVNLFQGLFTDYVASVLQSWQESRSSKLEGLGDDLRRLGLSWKIRTAPVYDTQVEIKVGRLATSTQGGAHDLVNLADVGIGVSQVLPFLVALRAAEKGQVVFVEQPEIHLHPKAQYALVDIILDAVSRGIKVWVETHSSSLLRGLQSRIAEGRISPQSVAMNWFSRDASTGVTQVTVAKINDRGQYGEWPVDFDDVALEIEKNYLNAVSAKSFADLKG